MDYNKLSEEEQIKLVSKTNNQELDWEFYDVIFKINNPSEAVQLAAVNNDPRAVAFIKSPTEAVQLASILKSKASFYWIKNPSDNAIQLHNMLWKI